MGHIDYSGFWALKDKRQYSTYRMIQDGVVSAGTLQAMRNHRPISSTIIARLCEALQCQPGDLMQYVSDAEEAAQKPAEGPAEAPKPTQGMKGTQGAQTPTDSSDDERGGEGD